jgi:hypothetical protein
MGDSQNRIFEGSIEARLRVKDATHPACVVRAGRAVLFTLQS